MVPKRRKINKEKPRRQILKQLKCQDQNKIKLQNPSSPTTDKDKTDLTLEKTRPKEKTKQSKEGNKLNFEEEIPKSVMKVINVIPANKQEPLLLNSKEIQHDQQTVAIT